MLFTTLIVSAVRMYVRGILWFSRRYAAAAVEIQVTALFSHFKLRERDGYLSRLNPHVPVATRKELRVSPLVGEYLFDEVLVSQAGDRLHGDVSLKSNTIMLDTLAKKSQDPRVRTLPQPKRPAPASTPLVSFKKPKQNPQPSGRGRGKFQGKGKNFSGQSAHRGKGRRAKDVRTFGRRRAFRHRRCPH